MAELRRYRDHNNATVWVNPDHIVAVAVIDNPSLYPRRWRATFTLTKGVLVQLVDDDPTRLHTRIQKGD